MLSVNSLTCSGCVVSKYLSGALCSNRFHINVEIIFPLSPPPPPQHCAGPGGAGLWSAPVHGSGCGSGRPVPAGLCRVMFFPGIVLLSLGSCCVLGSISWVSVLPGWVRVVLHPCASCPLCLGLWGRLQTLGFFSPSCVVMFGLSTQPGLVPTTLFILI